MLRIILLLFLLSTVVTAGAAEPVGNRLAFTQLDYDGEWDPYPQIYQDIFSFLTYTTSMEVYPQRQTIKITDEMLFYSPLVIVLNRGRFAGFTPNERDLLKKYINGGGILFIEDCSGNKYSDFDKKIRRELELIIPERRLAKIPKDHALLRSFYLLRGIAGRYITNNYIEGIDISGRTAVIYSQNDVFGAWVRDRYGNYFLECVPGGESQRFEAQKLTINIFLYSGTGTYKNDFIHKKFIEEKLKR
ncbi:MAG: hypothetical protein A2252_05465 [Elusimicrobia bacterium RIFOXYA2_FULL_39_19]|nr:MAG: hypothetical protein A2252_05465 [Elusimicrobia bacterium RIFOXYA2_FULL_39_19]